MTYASKGPVIFNLPNKLFPDCSPPSKKRSDGRLKAYSSILDGRVWSIDEEEQYRYLYDLMTGSQTCINRTSRFNYVPLEELIKLLLDERDAYIKSLEQKLEIDKDAGPSNNQPPTSRGKTPTKPSEKPVEEIYKAGKFEDNDDLTRQSFVDVDVDRPPPARTPVPPHGSPGKDRPPPQPDHSSGRRRSKDEDYQRQTSVDKGGSRRGSVDKDRTSHKSPDEGHSGREAKGKGVRGKDGSSDKSMDEDRSKYNSMEKDSWSYHTVEEGGSRTAWLDKQPSSNGSVIKVRSTHDGMDEETDTKAMRDKIAKLKAELEECRSARDTLRKAMHKLENIDEIVNENEALKARLRCSDEMIRSLKENKGKLEKELENLRTKSQIQMDLNEAQEMLQNGGQLAEERNHLQKRVKELQMELDQARSKQSEMELLKKQSETASMSLEEITRENECYKKKLASMKDLEKQIEELKKKANQIADKYKRDSMKASDQDRQLRDLSRELELLREERDRLKRRVDELACYEQQYNSLQSKLRQVDNILKENTMLNCKLASLDKLELENKLLKCQLEQCQLSGMQAEESREKIAELENAVADQEEEMKDLLCQIERLTRTYGDSSEFDRLKEELCKKEWKLRLCEGQLSEIPLLEAEIDELRCKLEYCCKNINQNPSPSRGGALRFGQEKTTVIGSTYEEQVAYEGRSAVCSNIQTEMTQFLEKTDQENKMSPDEIQGLLQSSKGIISCVLEDMIERQKEMEELANCNREMKEEITRLKAIMGNPDMNDFFREISELKALLCEKEKKIRSLEKLIARSGDLGKVSKTITRFEREIACLRKLNRQMRADLKEACCEIERCGELERLLEEEKRARTAAEAAAKQGESRTKLQKEEYNIEAKEGGNEVDSLRAEIEDMKKLLEKLRHENAALKQQETRKPLEPEETEDGAEMDNILNLLQSELEACRKGKMSDLEDLKSELGRLKEQNSQLKSLVDYYEERLDLEKTSNEAKDIRSSKEEMENKKLKADLAQMENNMKDLLRKLDECEKKHQEKSAEFDRLLESYNAAKEAEANQKSKKQDERREAESEKDKAKTDVDQKSKQQDVKKDLESEKDKAKTDVDQKSKQQDVKKDLESEKDKAKTDADQTSKQQKVVKEPVIEKEKAKTGSSDSGQKPKSQSSKKDSLTVKGTEGTDVKPKQSTVGKEKDKPKLQGESRTSKDAANAGGAAESVKPKQQNLGKDSDLEKDKKAIESAMKNVEEVDGLSAKLQEKQKLLQKQAELEAELEKLRQELKACKEMGPEKMTKDREEKLLEEMVGLREQAEQYKLENKKLKEDLAKLKDLLEECKKSQLNEEAQASLMSSKREGRSYPVQPAPKAVPRTVIPVSEEQRASVLERGKQQKMQKPEKASIIDATPNEVKVIVEGKSRTDAASTEFSDESIISFSDLDPGFKKFVCGLSPIDHRQNVCEIERRYRFVMAQLKEKNEVKLKNLINQHKKESTMRDKTYNENMSALRSGYESDIRKLVEKHKGSILRLQNLHEEEVEELNANHERQLNAILEQNENVVNDLTTGAANKFQSLAEQRSKDLKELEAKYRKLLEEKEEEYVNSAGGVDSQDAGSRYERELKRLKKSNLKRIDIMQQKYEKLLSCERKKYERQLEETIKKLKQGKGVSDGMCNCRFPICETKDPDAPLEFNDILQKILALGLESLSFNEVALVHKRTCAATNELLLNPDVKPLLLPGIVEEDNRDPPLKENKEELLNRILVLENEIAVKQMETQDAILGMELAVKAERRRLQELRDMLRSEREVSPDLKMPRSPIPPAILPSPLIGSARKAPFGFDGLTKPKMREQIHGMPPINIEAIIPGPRHLPKSGIDVQSVMEKIKELDQHKCLCHQVAPEKDTTKPKPRNESKRRSSDRDSNPKNKVPVSSRKNGKK